MKYENKAKQLSDYISKIVQENPNTSDRKIAQLLIEQHKLQHTLDYIRKVVGVWKKLESQKPEPTTIKTGLEMRDGYVINWSDKTIVTDLGEYGSYICSLDRHKLIQRKYVHDGEGETAAIVAMEFDFPHTKAVYKYAKIHGFSKASPPQTDIEFELGKTVDEAVEENIQTLKRKVYKQTQRQKWKETVDAANKWWTLENSLLESIEALTIELRERQISTAQLRLPDKNYRFSAFIGLSDMHYLKLCYNHRGEITYDRQIAIKRIKSHTERLASETSRYGRPERFFLMVGNDNIHVDGTHHTTTKGTTQHEATDGLWRLELKNYIQIQIDIIDFYKQIAPITLLPVKGNHDFETSIALQSFLEIYYRDDERVSVVTNYDNRTYVQYDRVCLIATHGDEMRSIANLEGKIHQLILAEAKQHGINVMDVEKYILFHGHEHVGSTRDLNGNVQRIGLSSLSDVDDWWHKGQGYMGRQVESQVIIIDPELGRKAILYA